jgi:hypothetical protein
VGTAQWNDGRGCAETLDTQLGEPRAFTVGDFLLQLHAHMVHDNLSLAKLIGM